MKILVVGSGAREHALCWKLAQSPLTTELLCTPGNPGTRQIARNLPFKANDIDGIVAAVQELEIDFVVVGPEEPLSLGLADALRALGVPTFGPGKDAARIETSKQWAKEIMTTAGIPTGQCVATNDLKEALDAVESFGVPIAIKADGLAAGKGVVIAQTVEEAEAALRSFMSDRSLGKAGEVCLVEEYLDGTELSVFALSDGKETRLFAAACDYKRVDDGDTGPNTGGMGAYAPPSIATPALLHEIMQTIIEPATKAMADTGSPMIGVLFAGLMLTASGPKVIEFNCRFGDPETQVLLPLLRDDLADLLYRTATGSLNTVDRISFRAGAAVGVVLASGGYPGAYETRHIIHGLDDQIEQTEIFQAGTRRDSSGEIVTAGGRVLTVAGTGKDMAAARRHAYRRVEGITFEGMQYRRDIALRECKDIPEEHADDRSS